MFPRRPDLNRGPWVKCEKFERGLAKAGREVYIIAGGAEEIGEFKGIVVPAQTWKIIVALERGRSWPDIDGTQIFAVMMPNKDGFIGDA